MDETALDSILEVQEAVEAPADFIANAVIANPAAQRASAAEDPEAVWEAAANELEWFRPWHTVVEGDPP
ncbi:MAG: acetyl-coenzyme A synthetase N-terminal domain-containing protein, partial [Acidobacteriota bacterium]|nr:acetyl-coenzyme A synthetase N-terminal domain-containing protein [Acidobacteriota bacterium]